MGSSAYRVVIAAAAMALAATAYPPESVSVVENSDIIIAPSSTYAWASRNSHAAANGLPTSYRLQAAIESGLAGKGFRQADDPASADIVVSYLLDPVPRTGCGVETLAACIGALGWRLLAPPACSNARLTIRLTDAASGRVAWRGAYRRRVDLNELSQDQLDAIASEIVKSLPRVTRPSSRRAWKAYALVSNRHASQA